MSLQITNRTGLPQTHRAAVGGLPGLSLSAPAGTLAPVGIQSIVARRRMPQAQVRPRQGKSVPMVFEVTARQDDRRAPAAQRGNSILFVPPCSTSRRCSPWRPAPPLVGVDAERRVRARPGRDAGATVYAARWPTR
jgi:hypothetical protein